MQKINRFLSWPLVLSTLFLLSLTATAMAGTDPPTPDTDVAGWLSALATAVTSKEWTPAVGLALLGVTYVLRTWVGNWIPWLKTTIGGIVLAFAISLVGTAGLTWAARQPLTMGLLLNALTNSSAAGLFWEWIKKLGKPPAQEGGS